MRGLSQGLVKASPTPAKSASAAFSIPSCFCSLGCKIVGTSRNFQKKKKQSAAMASDSEDSYSSSSHGRLKNPRVQSFTPSTPPPTSVNYRTAKRRKGIPHRAPMGGLIVEY